MRSKTNWRRLGNPRFTVGGIDVLRFDSATYTNSTANRSIVLPNKTSDPFEGYFNANTLATINYGGRVYGQFERSVTNEFTGSDDFAVGSGYWATSNSNVESNAVTAPDGIGMADKIYNDSTPASSHFVVQAVATDGSSAYCMSVFFKAEEYKKLRLFMLTAGFPSNEYVDVDTDLGVEAESGNIINSGVENLSNGWRRAYAVCISDAAASTGFRIQLRNNAGDTSYDGDGSSGEYIRGSQLEKSAWPTSYIPTIAVGVTRNKDEFYWSAANVPSWLRNKFAIRLIPYFSSDDIAENHYIAHFDDSGQDIDIYLDSAGKINIDGAGSLLQTSAHTWTRFDELYLIVEADDGSNCKVTTSGFATGDNTYTGTSFSTDDGAVYLGMDSATANQWDGLICEPYRI